MADLTDEDIKGLQVTASWYRTTTGNGELSESSLRMVGDQIGRAIDELQRHRAAVAANADRIRSVVVGLAMEIMPGPTLVDAIDSLGARAAEQLTTAAPVPDTARAEREPPAWQARVWAELDGKVDPSQLGWADAEAAARVLVRIFGRATYLAPERIADFQPLIGQVLEQLDGIAKALHLQPTVKP